MNSQLGCPFASFTKFSNDGILICGISFYRPFEKFTSFVKRKLRSIKRFRDNIVFKI